MRKIAVQVKAEPGDEADVHLTPEQHAALDQLNEAVGAADKAGLLQALQGVAQHPDVVPQFVDAVLILETRKV